jgi:pimeloyl-ACP methyl ester carboxylesterase
VSLAAEQMAESLFDVAERIPQPTLLAVGDSDHALGMNAGVHVLAKRLPRAILRVFTAGHALANEVPESLAAAAVTFLDGPVG